MHNQTWSYQYDPQYFSSKPGFKNGSRFNDEIKTLINFNNPTIIHTEAVKKIWEPKYKRGYIIYDKAA